MTKVITVPPQIPETVYEPSRGLVPINFRELWEYRELLYFLAWREFKVRSKQAALGVAWAILQPLFTMVVFSIIFGQLANLPSDGIPYPIFSYAGLLPWQFFAGAMTRASTSLVGNSNLLTKVYFPRMLIPLSTITAGLVDFAIAFVILLGMMLFYGISLTWNLLWLPLLLLLAFLTSLAVGLWFSALNVQYRDIQYAIPFLVQAWMYASPVAYSTGLIPDQGIWRIIYGLNPMAGVIQGFRWALLGGEPPDILMAVSILMVFLLLLTGLVYFNKMEKSFADVV
jgi:lipopolysaccharide transport system permease protein